MEHGKGFKNRRTFLRVGVAATIAGWSGCTSDNDEPSTPPKADSEMRTSNTETSPDSQTGSWPLQLHNSQNSSYAAQISGPRSGLQQQFLGQYPPPEGTSSSDITYSTPVIAGGQLYTHVAGSYITDDGIEDVNSLVAVNLETGDLNWKQSLDTSSASTVIPPAVADETVVHGYGSLGLQAFNAADGETLWTRTEPPIVMASPTIADGTIFVSAREENLAAFNLEDGAERWTGSVESATLYPPAVDGTAVFVSAGAEMIALDSETGEEQWRTEHSAFSSRASRGEPGPLHAPVVDDDTVYAAAGTRMLINLDNGGLAAFDRGDGTERWTFDFESELGVEITSEDSEPTGLYGPPALADGTLYSNGLVNGQSHLFAIDTVNGTVDWQTETADAGLYTPITVDTVYVVSLENIEVFDRQDGSQIGSVTVSDGRPVISWPASITEGTLAVPTSNGIALYSSDDPIEIRDWHDLDAVRTDLNADYRLVADLDVGTAGYNEHVGGVENGWEPIGEFDPENDRIEVFRGSFDGNGHTIGDVQIDRPNEDYVGLFARTRGAQISDLELVNVAVTGQNLVGALAGASGGISRCYTSGVVTGNEQVGGLVGYSFAGDITLSYADVDVTGSFSIGGLIGLNDHDGQIADSYSTGAVTGDGYVGGLVGESYYGTIANAYVTGAVSGDFDTGGLVGRVGLSTHSQKDEAIVANSYWDTHTTGQSDAVGAFKRGDGTVELRGDIAGVTTEEMQGDSAKEQMAAFNFDRTWQTATDPDGYPILQWQEDGTDSSQPEGFDPATHGFGFENWSGDSGETWDGEMFTLERESLDRDTVRDAIMNNWTYPVAGTVKVLAPIIQSQINRQTGSDGHCYGMVFSADDYYRSPEALPNRAATASDVIKPTGEFAPVGDKIVNYQTSQWLTAEAVWGTMFALQSDDINTSTTLEALTTAIDETGTAGIGLYDSADNSAHQVLAFNYDNLGDTIGLHIYDPVIPAQIYEGDDWETADYHMELDASTGELVQPHASYDRYAYIDPDLSLDLADAMTGEQGLFERFVNSLVVGLFSPARLDVEAPEDTTVIHPTPPTEDDPSAGYHDLVYVLGAEPDEYEIRVVGEDSGEYELEVQGVQDGEVTLEESATDTTEQGVEHAYTAFVPESSGESGSISRSDVANNQEDSNSTTTSPGTTDSSVGPTETESGGGPDDDGDGGLPSWVPIAGGGGLGIVGFGAYWYKRNGDNEDDTGE